MASKKRGLGKRKLSGLLSESSTSSMTANKSAQVEADTTPSNANLPINENETLREMPIEYMQRGKYQPRRDMAPEALEELAESIKSQGLMQPIIVRPVAEKKYEIIAGERRWRACQLANMDKVPVIIKDVPDDAAIAMALIENIQREDLNPIEEATALFRLQQEFELTQAEVAEAVGKSRSTVTNLLRLMSLRDDVRKMLEHGDLEMGHAKALLGLEGVVQSRAANQVVAKGLSVRQTESLVRKILEEGQQTPAAKKNEPNADIKNLEEELSQKLGSAVMLQHGAKGKGKLVIKYSSLDELDGVIEHLRR